MFGMNAHPIDTHQGRLPRSRSNTRVTLFKKRTFLCPHIERLGACCFTIVCMSVRPSVCLHKLNMKT